MLSSHLRKLRDRIRPWVGDATVALFATLGLSALYGSFSASGINTITFALILLSVAWILLNLCTFFVTHLYNFSQRARVLMAIASAIPFFIIGLFEYREQPALPEQGFRKVGLSCRHFGAEIPQSEDGRPAHVIIFSEEIPIPMMPASQDDIDNRTRVSIRSFYAESIRPDSPLRNVNSNNVIRCEFDNYTGAIIPNAAAMFLMRLSKVSYSAAEPVEGWVLGSQIQQVPLSTIGTSIHGIAIVYFVAVAKDVVILTKLVEIASCDVSTNTIKLIPILQDQINPDIYLYPKDIEFGNIPGTIKLSLTLPKLPERVFSTTCR